VTLSDSNYHKSIDTYPLTGFESG